MSSGVAILGSVLSLKGGFSRDNRCILGSQGGGYGMQRHKCSDTHKAKVTVAPADHKYTEPMPPDVFVS